MINANQAVETARQAGKDKQCPDEFTAAERLKDEAYALCRSCDTAKAIALAREATEKANALCPAPPVAVVEAPPAPPAKPPAPAAAVSLSASPASLQSGQCATLTWSSSNASSVSIHQGIGSVDRNGSRQVCPDRTTAYGITAVGEGGSRSASTTVTVSRVVDRLTLHANFDFNKATVRKPDDVDLQKAIAFIRKYPGFQVSLVGYTDKIGRDAYNHGLSEKVSQGCEAVSRGARHRGRPDPDIRSRADPVAAERRAEKGRFQNRRVEILILSE